MSSSTNPLKVFWSSQLKAIQEGGVPVLIRKAWKLPLRMFHSIWAVPVVLLARAMRPLFLIRFGSLNWFGAGHFVADAAEQWARLQKQPINTVDLFWLPSKTINDHWAKMIKRNMPVYPWVLYLDLWNRLLPGGENLFRPSSYTNSRDIEDLYHKYDARFPFLSEEEETAKEWLHQQGWQEGEPFVCLLVRDEEYNIQHPMHAAGDRKSRKCRSYHSYRNSDIETYVPAMEWLADQGVWVFRMGKIMAKPIPTQHPKIIDYAFNSNKSDLLDIWLFANCDFCITTSSGPDSISNIYRRPMLVINFAHPKLLWSWHEAVHVPKIMQWKDSGVELTCSEYWNNSFLNAEKYERNNIEIIDLTSNKIKESVEEFWLRIQGNWVDTEKDIKKNKIFYEIFKSQPDYHKYHGYVHPKSLIATCWLREKEEDFFV